MYKSSLPALFIYLRSLFMPSSARSSSRTGTSSLLNRLFRPTMGLAVSLAAASSFAAGPTAMKIGTVVWIGYGPFYVAEALGLSKK